MRWWRRFLRRNRLERELDAELRFHVEHQVADLTRRGLPEAEARRKARLAFGGTEQIKGACRDVRATAWVESVLWDTRYALRSLRFTPVVSTAVVLSLALGIGANTAVYTVIRAALLRALPVPSPNQLARLVSFDGQGDHSDASFSYRFFGELRATLDPRAEVFTGGNHQQSRLMVGSGDPEHCIVEAVSANYFGAMRVPAALGRVLVDTDDNVAGGRAVAVLSHAFWERRFGFDRSITITAPSPRR
ncbi:MAG: hypothetical protein GEV06_17545 [Luteitalea sp.]|nr:hypothetical protein [Luteitalea sp.]